MDATAAIIFYGYPCYLNFAAFKYSPGNNPVHHTYEYIMNGCTSICGLGSNATNWPKIMFAEMFGQVRCNAASLAFCTIQHHRQQ